MRYIVVVFVLAFAIINCDSSKNQENKEDASSSGKVVDGARYAVEDAKEEIPKQVATEKPPAKDTLGDLNRFLQKTFKNDSIISWKTGDITNDTIDDFVVVLQSIEEPKGDEDVFDAYQRKVVLLQTMDSYPNFKLRGLNESIIGCLHCGGAGVGDPFGSRGVVIKGNYFSIEQLYGACTKSFEVTTYKYDTDKDNWFLHKVGSDTYSCNHEPVNGEIPVDHKEETTKDFGEVPFSKENYK